tara:strand:- start:17 stop:544 length:528 start_codon:yes stop_codon:yes gene_type:complete
MLLNIIVALCENNGIGKNNSLPWSYKEELIHFSKMTKGNGNNAIIMGKNTWNSLPKKPLPKREHYVLSSSYNCITNINYNNSWFCNSFETLFNHHKIRNKEFEECWFIGGEKIYKEVLNKDYIDNLVISYIPRKFDCDTFFPDIPNNFVIKNENKLLTADNTEIKIITYKNNNKE